MSIKPWGLIGASVAMSRLRRELARLAATESTVLITGETGTGKGVAARTLHRASARSQRAWVHVDCAALSTTVIENELFGHERGAFTGALDQKPGRLEQAASGTLFLDEIAEISPPLQAKLLRALQDREFERVGGNRTLRLSARVVAATNQNLGEAIRQQRFRADLYYRLHVGRLHLPPLRDRLEDLPELVSAGIARAAKTLGRPVPSTTPQFLTGLHAYPWPGNVRELFNFLERTLLGPDETLTAKHAERLHSEELQHAPSAVHEVDSWTPSDEQRAIRAALRASHGNVTGAARRLGWPRSTLRYRILIYGMEHQVRRNQPRPRRPVHDLDDL